MLLQKRTTHQQLLIIPVMLVLFVLALLFIFNLQAVRPSLPLTQSPVTMDSPAQDLQESAPELETANVS